VLFLDEPTNGVDPVSRRDFWAILYQLVRDGLTVFVTTAYLDEAERANRVGFMHHGQLIRCDTPAALKRGLEEDVYVIHSPDMRAALSALEHQPGVLTAQPSGADLHVFLDRRITSPEKLRETCGYDFKKVEPSLEDIFIALVRKSETRRDEAPHAA
jgi:ABC-2 type transport system ATP-binding protein